MEPTITAANLQAPPPWALLQRELFDFMAEAVRYAAGRYGRPDGTPLNLWRATPCGDGWVEGLEGTEDLGAEGDKQAGEGFTALWHGEGEAVRRPLPGG